MTEKDQYDETGYVVLREFLSDMEISQIAVHVDRIYDEWISDNEAEVFKHKLVNMHSLSSPEYFEGMPEARVEFFNAISPVKLTDRLENIFGPGIGFHNTQLFFNPLNEERLPYWHRDMQYSTVDDEIQRIEQDKILALHIRVPLVGEKGVELVSGTHRRWDTELERNVRLELNGRSNNEPLPGARLIELQPGDVLIFNAQMIHRGNYELNDARKALDICAGKYHYLSAEFLDEKVLPNEGELSRIVNNGWYVRAREAAAKQSGRA